MRFGSTLAEAGLDSWWSPAGVIRNLLEFCHMNLDLSWCTSIVIVTVGLKASMFYFWLKGQRGTIAMHNAQPEFQKVRKAMTEAKRRGDEYEEAMLNQEMMKMYMRKDISPFRQMLPLIVQAPIFMGMFFGLKGMSNAPIFSLQNEAVLWIPSLTVPDPYYIIPLFTAASFYGVMYFGSEGGRTLDSLGPILRRVMYSVPVVIAGATCWFPASIGIYFTASNLFSLSQAALITHPYFQKKLNVPKRIIHDVEALRSKEGFVKSVKKFWSDTKMTNEINRLQDPKQQEDAFRASGVGAIPKTYAYDPTLGPPPTTKSKLQPRKRRY